MKRSIFLIPFIICALTATTSVGGQDVSGQDHRMRDGDIINPLVSRDRHAIIFNTHNLDENGIGKDTSSYGSVEVFEELFYEDEETARAMIFSQGDTIYFIRNGIRHLYHQANDTLGYLGYDSRLTRLRLDHAVPVAVYPLRDVTILTDTATATVEYSQQSLLRRATVASRSETSKGWRPGNTDVVPDNLTRLEWSLCLRYDTVFDSAPDSNPSPEGLTQTFTEWYADGLRYPVIRNEATHVVRLREDPNILSPSDTLMTLTRSYLHTREQQYTDTGEESYMAIYRNKESDYGSGSPDPGFPVTVSQATIDGGNVTVVLSATGENDEKVTVSVHTLSGILLAGPVTLDVTADKTELSMTLSRDNGDIPILVITTPGGLSCSFPIIR